MGRDFRKCKCSNEAKGGKYSFGGEEKGRKYLEKENHLLAERENTRDGQVAT